MQVLGLPGQNFRNGPSGVASSRRFYIGVVASRRRDAVAHGAAPWRTG